MSAVYTRRLFYLHAGVTRPAVTWTVPSDGTYVLRDLLLSVNEPSGACRLYLALPGNPFALFFYNGPITSDKPQHLELRQALGAGDVIGLIPDAQATNYVAIGTGYYFAA